jgi:tripartite-type tricarboxylate transporter receptor subunit TctC
MSEHFKQPFYVDSIAGAGGNSGTGQAAKAAPDGHTVLFAFGTFVVIPSLFTRVPYDACKDSSSSPWAGWSRQRASQKCGTTRRLRSID